MLFLLPFLVFSLVNNTFGQAKRLGKSLGPPTKLFTAMSCVENKEELWRCRTTNSNKMLIIPGYDSKTGNTNSCLYKTYGETCYMYTPESELKPDQSEIAVVHSYGFFIFLVGQSKGLFPNVKKVIVIDGYFPRDKLFKGETFTITFPKMHFVFLFPTIGDRADYPLESIVRQAMANGARFGIVRAIGYGHNLIFKDVKDVGTIVESLKEFEETDSEGQLKFPESHITYT